MGRNIIREMPDAQYLPGPQREGDTADNYASRIVKLIPADIVGVYLGLQGLFSGVAAGPRFWLQASIFIIILIIAPLFLRRVAKITDKQQVTIAVISYIVWAISLGGPFDYLMSQLTTAVSAQQIGGALVMIYTLIVPMLYGRS